MTRWCLAAFALSLTLLSTTPAEATSAQEILAPKSGKVIFVRAKNEMTPYEKSKGKPEGVATGMMVVGPGPKNPATACLNVQGVNIRIRNHVFANCTGGGARVGLGKGEGATIENNVFVAARFAAINSRGMAKSGVGKTVIKNNTILFSWSRLKGMNSQGYGIEVRSGTLTSSRTTSSRSTLALASTPSGSTRTSR